MASFAAPTGFSKALVSCPSSSSSPRASISTKSHQYPQIVSSFTRKSVCRKRIASKFAVKASTQSDSAPTSSAAAAPGIYSARKFDLTPQNVNLVLEDVRPYLIADGGDVDVVSVEDGVVSLKLLGACGSCPSSTTTMKMGIEKVLKEKFGDSIMDIQQVFDEEVKETTVEAVNDHLDILRPAIKNYGGSVQVLSVEGGDCVVNYVGPESIGSGIRAAIKEKFPDISNVTFTG